MKKLYALCLAVLLSADADAAEYWLMNTRPDCNNEKKQNICGLLQLADGSGQASTYGNTTIPLIPLGGFGVYRTDTSSHLPIHRRCDSSYTTSGYIFAGLSLTPTGPGFYVFGYDTINDGWVYQGRLSLGGTSTTWIQLDVCEVTTPGGVHGYTFSCIAPTPVDKPPVYGGGACEGQPNPSETCGSAENVVWEDKEACQYHCAMCENQVEEWRAYCQTGTLVSYGAAEDCNYYCDCAKGTAERNQVCPFGSNVDSGSCKYVCKPCVQLEIECENTCQASTGSPPVEMQCQETLLGTPYDYKCTCSDGSTPGDPGDPSDPGEECAYCDLIPQIKSDTEALISATALVYDDTQYLVAQSDAIKSDTEAILGGQQEVVNILGQIYDISADHFYNNEMILGQILAAINANNDPQQIDLSPVVNAVNGLHSYFDAINYNLNQIESEIQDFQTDMHSALYNGQTPYLASILEEMRRITMGLLESDSGAQAGSLVDRMRGAIYLNSDNEWVFRTDIVIPEMDDGTSIWDWLLAALNTFSSGLDLLSSLLDAYFAGTTPDAPEYSSWDLSDLAQYNDPAYQANETLSQLDVSGAAASSASRYNALPRPSISLLNPDPCIVGSSGLSICFNTDVWQSLYVQLRMWGYFFAHLSVFIMVYRARTGISPSSSGDV